MTSSREHRRLRLKRSKEVLLSCNKNPVIPKGTPGDWRVFQFPWRRLLILTLSARGVSTSPPSPWRHSPSSPVPLRQAPTYDECFHGNRPDKTMTMQGSRCWLLVPDWPARGGLRPAHSSRGLSVSDGNKSTCCSPGVRHRVRRRRCE